MQLAFARRLSEPLLYGRMLDIPAQWLDPQASILRRGTTGTDANAAPVERPAQARFDEFAEAWRGKYPAMVAMWERT